jgi:phospholipid/cholesterol/gamma-HCH transport system ATP-binding protein
MADDTSVKPNTDDKQNDIAVIEMEHLKKSFETNQVLRDINMKVYKGENLVILGKSGTGKSVLIKCIVGLIDYDAGKLVIFGKDVAEQNQKELIEIRKRIGFLFQNSALYDSMTVRENLEFPLKRQLKKTPKDEIDKLVKEALDNVGLADTIDKMPSELSGGMRKRLGLARTLILKPEIMLYDEPTTGLDPITSREISKLIQEVQTKYDTSSIIITHDIECAKLTASRIVVLKDGICAAEGSYAELENSTDEWIKSFFFIINLDKFYERVIWKKELRIKSDWEYLLP